MILTGFVCLSLFSLLLFCSKIDPKYHNQNQNIMTWIYSKFILCERFVYSFFFTFSLLISVIICMYTSITMIFINLTLKFCILFLILIFKKKYWNGNPIVAACPKGFFDDKTRTEHFLWVFKFSFFLSSMTVMLMLSISCQWWYNNGNIKGIIR